MHRTHRSCFDEESQALISVENKTLVQKGAGLFYINVTVRNKSMSFQNRVFDS